MALQRPPPSPHPSNDHQRTPPLSPSTPGSSQPSLSSTSTSESSLSPPFERLTLDDRPEPPLSPRNEKPHFENAHDTSRDADVIHSSQDLSGEMLERMQDTDRMPSRRPTPSSEYLSSLRVPEQMVWTHVGECLPRHARNVVIYIRES